MRLRVREVYHQLVAEGKCVQCGKRYATPGETMCEWCRERKAQRNRLGHARALLRGCCPRHRGRKVAKGYRQCLECVNADRARKQEARSGNRIRQPPALCPDRDAHRSFAAAGVPGHHAAIKFAK